MRLFQNILEILSHLKTGGELRYTQGGIEYSRPNPPAADIRLTQGVIETAKHPLVDVWYTQGVIEVAWPFPGPPPPPPPPPVEVGNNNAMLIFDLSAARDTMPDYEPATVPDY